MSLSTASPRSNARTQFLDPSVLTRIRNLELVARAVVDGFISGLHHSPNPGFSLDFAAYRQYMPGDDIRRIDWKVYARSDRYYVKEFEGETSTQVHLLLDVSGSMGYQSRPGPEGISKIEYASFLTASLAYLVQKQRDSVGLVTFDNRVRAQLPPRCRATRVNEILHMLEKVRARERGELTAPLCTVAGTVRRRGIVVLISDLFSPTEEVTRSLSQFRFKGNDVVIFQVLDPQELEFNFTGGVRLEDLESKEEAVLAAERSKTDYLRRLREHIACIRRECGVLGIDHEILDTSKPLDYALYSYLHARRKSM